jgi:hypothetical protein
MKAHALWGSWSSRCLAVAFLQLLATVVFAAHVPAGAESRALGLEPIFREGAALVFLHPQQAVLQPQQLLVLDTGSGSLDGMGGILAVGGQRLFLFSTRDVVYAGSMSGVKAGWAGQAGGLRVGLSAGGYLLKASSVDERLVWTNDSDFSYSFNANDGYARSIEGLVGLGVGRGRRYLDLAWESRWETADRATAKLGLSESKAETTIVSLEGDRRPLRLYHLRGGLPLGSATDLLVMGQWGGRHERWKGTFRGIIFTDELFRQEALEGWRDSWRAGAAVSFPLGELDRITASASWASGVLPEYLTESQSVIHRVTSRRDGALALSVEERVWREITLLAGLRRTYVRSKVNRQILSPPTTVSSEIDLNERLAHDFTWGASWAHRGYWIGALVSNTLQLNALAGSLDLGYRF